MPFQKIAVRRLLPAAALVALACVGGNATPDSPPPPPPPTPPPAPTITALLPDSAFVLDTGFTIIVSGTGFVAYSTVVVDGAVVPAEFVGPARLTAPLDTAKLDAVGSSSVMVVNPATHDTSNVVVLHIVNAKPALTLVTPDTTEGGTGFLVTVHGHGFVPQSAIQWNGTPLTTTFVSTGQLRAQVPAAQVALGRAAVSVNSPEPGGGTSDSASVAVLELQPAITALSPDRAAVGGAPFTLTLTGRNFAPTSQVRWNGLARTTTFVNGDTLTVSVTAGDIASQSSARIVVTTPGAGGSSDPEALPILSGSVALTSDIRVSIPNADVVYDSTRGLLYATVPDSSGAYSNSVVAIDPATGTVQWSTAVDTNPARLAISDDDSQLYVLLKGTSTVDRINPGTHAIDLRIPLGVSPFGPVLASDLATLPGLPGSVALVLGTNCCGESVALGVAVFDDTVPRPRRALDADQIVAGSLGDTLYGKDNAQSTFDVSRMFVSDGGLVVTDVKSDAAGVAEGTIAFSGERLYSSSGIVLDARTLAQVAKFPFSGAVLRPDAAGGRVFVQAGHTIETWHYTGLDLLGTLYMSGAPEGTVIIRWGPDGIVLAGGSELSILRSPLIGP